MTRQRDAGGPIPHDPPPSSTPISAALSSQVSGKPEGRYRVLFENSPLSLWEEDWSGVGTYLDQLRSEGVVDLDDHFGRNPEAVWECVRRVRIVDVNQATLDLFRAKDKAELLGNLERFFTSESLVVFRDEAIALARGDKHFEAEAVHRTLTGEIIEIALYLNVVPQDDGALRTVLVTLLDITQRKRAEADLRRQREALCQMLEFQEHERRLVGYEIHDGLAQQLAGAVLFLQAFREQSAAALPEAARKTLDSGIQLVREAMGESRRLIDDLRPTMLEENGLAMAVANLAAQVRARWGMEIELVCDLPAERYASGLETAVFRMVQEALANVRAHARTRKARVELAQQGESLRAEVRDWGAGFDPRQAPAGHYGLEGIHERVRLLGGRVTVRSAPGEGTLIAVELPVRGA